MQHLTPAIDYAVYLVVRMLICVVQAVRIETCEAAAKGLAALFHRVLKIRASVIDENLAEAYPHLSRAARDAMARAMWEHLFLMVAEIGHARRKIHAYTWRRHFSFVRASEIVNLTLSDRPVVFVSGHFGNFEMGGFLLGLFGMPTYTIARPLDNPYLNRFLNEFRGTTGQYMLPKEGSAQRIAELLDQGAAICALGDQAAGPKGCWIEFFGRPASSHKAIAVFSLTSDCPLAVTFCRRLDGPLKFETGMQGLADPLDSEYNLGTIPALTQWYNDQLEQAVRRAPEQYWWLHRRWKGEPRRSPARRAA